MPQPHNGYWVVLETGQGGGIPDTVHGPFWDQAEADTVAKLQLENARQVGRADRFQTAYADIDFDESESEVASGRWCQHRYPHSEPWILCTLSPGHAGSHAAAGYSWAD